MGSIGKTEFSWLMQNPEIHAILDNFGVNCKDLLKMQDIFFEEYNGADDEDDQPGGNAKKGERSLSFHELLEKIMQLRGGNACSVHDIVELREFIGNRLDW